MKISIDEKSIEAKVMDKQKAENKYNDAVAGGNAAAIMRNDVNNQDLYQIDIGNILPG